MRKQFNLKQLLVAVAVMAIAMSSNVLNAQVAGTGIFFQAVARDSYSNPAKDRKIVVETSLIQTSAKGTVVLREFFETTTDATGVFSVSIGQGTRLAGTVSNLQGIDWSRGPFYLNLKIAIAPMVTPTNWDYTKDLVDLGTSPFGAVPFAMFAGSVSGMDAKVNVSDTSRMLLPYVKTQSFNSLSVGKLNVADSITKYVTPAQLAAKTFDQTPITNAIASKVNIADSITKYVTPTQLNSKTFDSSAIYNQLSLRETLSNKSINVNTDGTSDVKYPSAKAVKTYVDASIVANTTPLTFSAPLSKSGFNVSMPQANGSVNGYLSSSDWTSFSNKIDASQKAAVNGVATLGNDGKIPSVQIPAISFQNVSVVNSSSAMTSISGAQVGSIAIRTDNNNNYVLSALPASTLSNWIALATPIYVSTVNGFVGPNVVLTTNDVNEGSTNKYYTDARVRGAISATAPLTFNSATGAFGIPQASISADGFLSATDWSIFKNKQNALTAGTDYVTPAQITLSSLGAEAVANKSNDMIADSASTTKYPSVKSIKTYVDQQSANAGVADNSITTAKINGTISINKGGTGATTAAGARTNLGLVIGTDVMAANATTTLTGDVTGSGNGSFATTVNSVGGLSASTIAGLPTSVAANTASITANRASITSNTNAIAANTASITANATAIAAEATTARAAEQALTISVNANTASITTNTASITSNTNTIAANTASITANATAIAAEATTARAAEQALTTSVNANTASITSNTSAIAANTASITANASAIAAEVTTARAAEQALTTSVNANTASITSNTNAIAANTASITANTSAIAANTVSITANTNDIALRATIASPSFTGTPTAPTPITSDNSTRIATTEYVKASITAANAGVSTVGPIAASANANGATISGSTQLILTPADANFGGVVTTASQTFAGAKTFSNTVTFNSDISVNGIKIGLGNSAGSTNTGLGFGTLGSVTTAVPGDGKDLTAVGYNALPLNTNGYANTAVGQNSLFANTSGFNNTAIGKSALSSNISGRDNFAGGVDALKANSAGQYNTAIGGASLTSNTSGEKNTAVGYWALRHLAGFTSTSSNNTAIGADAGRFFGSGTNTLSSSSKGVFLGSNTRPSANLSENEVVIGADAVGNGSNTVTIGNASNTATYFTGDINLTGRLVGGTWSGTTLAIANGGTGATTASAALTNLGAEATANKSIATDLGNTNPSDVLFPSQKAVKTYVDAQTAAAGVADGSITNLKLAGSIAASKLIGSDISTVGTITTGVWSGTAIANEKLANSTTTLGATTLTLGGTVTSVTGLTSLAATNLSGTLSGTATAADKLTTARTISTTGDITYTSGSFDGTANVTGVATLANSGVVSGTYGSSTAIPTFTVDSKGRLTAASTVGIIAGVNSLNYTSTTSYAAGGTISGTSLTLTAADGTNPGLVSTGAQTIAGAKTFSSDVTAPNFIGNLSGNATTATTAGNITATSNTTLTSLANLATVGTITSGVWSGTAIANNNLANSALTLGSTNIALGATTNALAGLSTVTSTNFVGNLTGNVTGALTGNAATATALATARNINGVAFDGSTNITIAADANTLTGTTLASNVVTSSLTSVGTITSGVWSGTAIANNKLANSTTTLGSTTMTLGGTVTSVTGLTSLAATNLTGALTGNASTATALATARNINGVAFDGSANITIAADANTLTGTTLASNVVNSSLTGVGTITSGTWNAATISAASGGTGLTSPGTSGNILTSNGTAWVSSPISAVTSLGTFTTTAYANGGTISGTTLTLSAANATNSGLLTAGTQTIGGAKTFSNTTTFSTDILVNSLTVGRGNNGVVNNTAIGDGALFYNLSSGTKNTAIGYNSLNTNSSGYENTAIGSGAMDRNTTGYSNTAVGFDAMSSNTTTGYSNQAIGKWSLFQITTGYENTAIGQEALYENTTGYRNVAIGNKSILGLSGTAVTGNNNIGIGYAALTQISSGNNNIGIGSSSMGFVSNGNRNVALGINAGSWFGAGQATNSATSINDNIFIGYDVRPLGSSDNNEIVISNSTSSTLGNGQIGLGSNTTLIGNTSTQRSQIYGALTVVPNNATSGAGNSSTIAAQNGFTNSNGGALNLTAGNGNGTGIGGNVVLTPGTGATAGQVQIAGTTVITGAATISNTTASSSTTTGALTVGGGTGIAGALNVGGTTSLIGAATISNTTTSTSTSTGALVVRGGVGVAENLNVGGNTKITGTLEIDGGSPAVGKVLTSDANGVGSWTYSVGSTVLTSTSNYAITLAEAYVFYNGSTTGAFTIPAAAAGNAGKTITIKNKSAFNIVITPSSTLNIYIDKDNTAANTVTIGVEASNNWIKLVSDGSQWNVMRALF